MNRPPSGDYIQNLAKTLAMLPSQYTQVSISGGEPTISPDFLTILYMIKASQRFKKVVLTTNGTKLEKFIPHLQGLVDHINISRHGIGYEKNAQIFGNKSIPNDEALKRICTSLNKIGIDVTFNHVYMNPSSDNSLPTVGNEVYVRQYVDYAKQIGASAVAFRFDQNLNTLAPTFAEQMMERAGYTKINQTSCPVCRSHTHLVNGMSAMFKASLAEPGDTLPDEIYELIYHIDGRLCTDWAGRNEYDPVSDQILPRSLLSIEKLRQKLSATHENVVEPLTLTTPSLLQKIQNSKPATNAPMIPTHSCGSSCETARGCGVPACGHKVKIIDHGSCGASTTRSSC